MSVFLIADIEVTDDAWVPEYAAHVHHIVEKHGGRYLSRSGRITRLEGEESNSTLIAILEFPSEEALRNFTQDPAYAPYGEARRKGSNSSFRMIDDSDLAAEIPYLPAG